VDLQLTGKVAVVTAASRGLGRGAALQLAREGANVAICARGGDVLETAETIRRETGADVLAVRADVTQQADIDALIGATLDRFGKIDILIVNAGGPPPGRFLSLTPEDWQQAVDLTLMSAVRLCYAVVPHMVARGSGSIVATESISIKQPIDNLILSNAVRLAVVGLMKSLANELGPMGIRVNTINPGSVQTERLEHLMATRAASNDSSVEEELAKAAADVPLRRIATVEEYGQAIAWLASPAAAYIHGQAVMFDGGLSQSPL
jgi:3-oxoacyl-[acyl-carrier protein] reductase